MSNEQKFVDGLRVYAPRDNAPDFVIADLVIEHDDFSDWLADRGDKVRITIKRSKGGKLYAVENDYKPEGQRQQSQRASARQAPQAAADDFEDSEIQF